jgi:pimeloyl-ACP methyl ester carboxylesterase
MPFITRDDAQIYFEEHGSGYPILMLAHGGMQSEIQRWHQKPPRWLEPACGLVGRFRLIVMDQRNAGRSSAPITADVGWQSYAADQLAVLEHLGIERCHIMGGCIGAPFGFKLFEIEQSRFTAAVFYRPWGVHDNRAETAEVFEVWAKEMRARRDVDARELEQLHDRMFGGDFIFSVPRSLVERCGIPLLILGGEDKYHPREISQEIARLAPDAELVWGWNEDATRAATIRRVNEFFARHTPAARSEQ